MTPSSSRKSLGSRSIAPRETEGRGPQVLSGVAGLWPRDPPSLRPRQIPDPLRALVGRRRSPPPRYVRVLDGLARLRARAEQGDRPVDARPRSRPLAAVQGLGLERAGDRHVACPLSWDHR
jgi:hypothetical protein